MSSSLFSAHDSHTLLVDADVVHGEQLLKQLNRAGCRTYLAVSWLAAHVALAENLYDSCIVVAHLDRAEDLDHLDRLRRAAQSVWIIVLSDLQLEIAQAVAHPEGVDAVLSVPFSMHDLTSRLAAFSLRPRPTF
jgi:two-component system response regulator QseB